MARKTGRGYVVEATVCDTIRSQPAEKGQAKRMMTETKRRIPRAKVHMKRA